MNLTDFTKKIPDFYELKLTEQIVYFAYYEIKINNNNTVTARDINQSFDDLNLPKYSNTSAFLSKRSRKPDQIFLKKKQGYSLTAQQIERIDKTLNKKDKPKPSNDLLTLDSFKNTRKYLEKIAAEINICYDTCVYTACAVLIRRLVETLIVEAYESKNLESSIKDSGDDYLMFSALVNAYINETALSPSRDIKRALPKIKRLGDNAAHNRKFIAKKVDIDDLKTDINMTIAELLGTIDY